MLVTYGAGWEAFNRHMDEQDRAVAAAAAIAKARDESGNAVDGAEAVSSRADLPHAMVEVMKVALSLLRRLANRNLGNSINGPFATGMTMFPSGHPQVCPLSASLLVIRLHPSQFNIRSRSRGRSSKA